MFLTFSDHADFEAFLESAVLASAPVSLVDGTVPVSSARVSAVLLDGSLEEA